MSNDHPENRNHTSRFHGSEWKKKSNLISNYWREVVTISKTLRVREK